MLRINNLYQSIISVENLLRADQNARRGKLKQYGVQAHDKNRVQNIDNLHHLLVNMDFRTSEYKVFTVYEPKERIVYKLPYYPDRIVHHAIMNVLEPIFISHYNADTYACIKGRGIHSAANKLRKALRDVSSTKYCLKLDIRKFYPSVDHDVLKGLLRRKFKDKDLLYLLDEIIDSAPGLPIGNYLSQYLANYYLSNFDHWIKQDLRVKYYFRYADDMVILSQSKPQLHAILHQIKCQLELLKLEVKGNYQVFPVKSRGIDFIGYKFFHTHTLLRKSIKQRFVKAVRANKSQQTIAAYIGWAKHCDSNHLLKTILGMKAFNELNIDRPTMGGLQGDKIKIERLLNRKIVVEKFTIGPSKQYQGQEYLSIQLLLGEQRHVVFTGSKGLIQQIKQVPETDFPFQTTIINEDRVLMFT